MILFVIGGFVTYLLTVPFAVGVIEGIDSQYPVSNPSEDFSPLFMGLVWPAVLSLCIVVGIGYVLYTAARFLVKHPTAFLRKAGYATANIKLTRNISAIPKATASIKETLNG